MSYTEKFIYLGIFTIVLFIILMIIGIGMITKKVFNYNDTITVSCPDVNIKDFHHFDTFKYVKLNSEEKINVLSKSSIVIDSINLGLIKFAMLVFWLLFCPIVIYLLFLIFNKER